MGILVFASPEKIELYGDVHVRSSMSGLMGKWHVSRFRRDKKAATHFAYKLRGKVELIKTSFFA
jgi:hypothetical protein